MRLTFYGGAESVTGANYLLELHGEKIIIDCGLTQGSGFCKECIFTPFPYAVKDISAVVITHAHIDHTGLVPKLYHEGFRGNVYSTPPTKSFAELLLTDSEHLLKEEARKYNKAPLYDLDDIAEAFSLWKEIPYEHHFSVGPFKIHFINAGHILGSASVVIEANGKKIVFSGDLGNTYETIIKPTTYVERADYALVESVYGDRLHEEVEMRGEKLKKFVEKIINRGGTILIPAFAMERTQQVLFELNNLIEQKKIPRVPVFLDSPLAIKLTEIYARYKSYFRSEVQKQIHSGDDIFKFSGLKKTLTSLESKKIWDGRGPKIIIAGSGMSNGGRILHHEKKYLPDPNNGILFIGYQAEETLGRAIKDGQRTVMIDEQKIPVRCEVEEISGYSAHADRDGLLKWVSSFKDKVKKIYVTQGENEVAENLAYFIKKRFKIEAIVPKERDSVVL